MKVIEIVSAQGDHIRYELHTAGLVLTGEEMMMQLHESGVVCEHCPADGRVCGGAHCAVRPLKYLEDNAITHVEETKSKHNGCLWVAISVFIFFAIMVIAVVLTSKPTANEPTNTHCLDDRGRQAAPFFHSRMADSLLQDLVLVHLYSADHGCNERTYR